MSLRTDRDFAHWRLPEDKIQDVRLLHKGHYSTIWLVKYKKKELLASKRLCTGSESKIVEILLKEARTVATLEHPNIVTFVGVAWTSVQDMQILFEYMAGGSLRQYLKMIPPLAGWTREKLRIAISIVEALSYTHSFTPPIIHRNVTSNNILLTKNYVAKLSDFGSSRPLSTTHMTAGVGTAMWLAPEAVAGSSYSESADIYSFGVVLSELDTQKLPYEELGTDFGNSEVELAAQVCMGRLKPSFRATTPQSIIDLGSKCLEFDPQARPHAIQVAYELRNIKKDIEKSIFGLE